MKLLASPNIPAAAQVYGVLLYCYVAICSVLGRKSCGMRVWLKAEVFEYGALQFPPRSSGEKLTPALFVNLVKALQNTDPTVVR